MPLSLLALALARLEVAIGVNLLGLLRRDDADFIICCAAATGAVVDWMNVKSRGRWLPAQLSKALD